MVLLVLLGLTLVYVVVVVVVVWTCVCVCVCVCGIGGGTSGWWLYVCSRCCVVTGDLPKPVKRSYRGKLGQKLSTKTNRLGRLQSGQVSGFVSGGG